jgi:quercetin dioxygenase-like cupin family protein
MQPDSARIGWRDMERTAALPGITMALALGERMSTALFSLDPSAVVPEHVHDNEEYGHVLTGSLELHHAGQKVVIAAGDGFLIPAGEPHSAVALVGGCELLECYAPARVPTPPKEEA